MAVQRAPSDGAPSPKFGLSLLGGFELTGPDGVVDLPSKKLAGLLAYLACTTPRPQSREKLSALLWGSYFDAQAKQNLRQALFRLRKVLGEDILESDGEVVSLNPAAVSCDVRRFEALVHDGSRDALSAAVDLYRGSLIDAVSVGEEGWNEWLTAERERLLELALGAMVELAEQELAGGRAEAALKAAQRAIALNDMREDAHRLVIQALAATGRKAEALAHYGDLVALFKRELSTEPDAVTKSLVAALRSPPPPDKSSAVKATAADRAPPSAETKENAGREASAESPAPPADAAAPAGRPASLERRQLTIMACNMVGAIPRLDPEDMRDLVGSFHKTVASTVARFGGYVAQYLSDGVLVYFGFPEADEHDAERAVRAGLATVEALGALKSFSGLPVHASVGIASGLVVVGDQPWADDARQRIAIGETPNLAARIQAAAAPGEVAIATGTLRLVGRRFDCHALASTEQAWRVSGEKADVSRFEARRSGELPPLIGRQEEINLLMRRWEQARLGEGQVVLLSGEPGIGKSRIAEAVVDGLEDEPHACLRYSCSPHHAHSPLYPLIAQLQRVARFGRGSNAGAKLDKLESLLKPVAKNLARDVTLIADLLSVPTDGRYPALVLAPQQKREMTLKALIEQVEQLAAQGPVLILVEDVHWIDPTSQDLLDRMVAHVANLPVLLIVTFRPELQPSWIGQPHVKALPLNRLGRRDSTAIVAGITGDKALPDALIVQILARADGIPLFIEELTSSLLESGLLREQADQYVLDGPLPQLAIPTTLQASLVARLDRLGPVKDLAQLGAAIGREFSHELLAAVAGQAPVNLDLALVQLTASGLVSRRGLPPEATYTFKHALVQDAAYGTLLKDRRQRMHGEIAKALVERFPAMAENQPEVIAHHFTEAGAAGEAIGYWRKAGKVAAARSAGQEAATFFERALHLLKTLPEDQSTLEQGCDVRLELRPVLMELGRSAQMLESLHEADALAERLNDDRRRGLIGGFMTIGHSFRANFDEALEAGSRALEIAGRLDDLKTRIVATSLLVQVYFARGEYERSVELAIGNLAVLPADWVHETFGLGGPPAMWDRGCLIQGLSELGRFSEAARYEDEMMRLVEPTQRAITVGLTLFSASVLPVAKGDWAQALSRIDPWIALARKGNFVFHLAWALASSVWPLAQLGRTREALDRLAESEPLLDRLAVNGVRANLGWFYRLLGHACMQLGRPDEARRLAGRTLEFCALQPGFEAYALHLLGEAAAHPDRFDAEQAEVHYRQALAAAERLKMRPLVAHCHFGLGKVYLHTKKRDRARDDINVATTMYRDMGMAYWLEQAEAEMRK